MKTSNAPACLRDSSSHSSRLASRCFRKPHFASLRPRFRTPTSCGSPSVMLRPRRVHHLLNAESGHGFCLERRHQWLDRANDLRSVHAHEQFSILQASHPTPAVTLTVATPTYSPGGDSYSVPTNVVISCVTEGASIYYTTNGNTPTASDSFIYSGGSVSLVCSVTLKARAFKSGYDDSVCRAGATRSTALLSFTPVRSK